MEKIIHFTVPAKLTPVNVRIIELARKLHPTWEVKVWQDPMQPDGYPLEKYWPKANSGAQLSDLLRLDVLYKWGGVYVDGDMRLLKPLDELVEQFDFFIASHDGRVPINALIGASKAHPAIQALIDELLLNEPDWSLPPDRTTGPDIFVRALKWDTRATVLPRETFYSYGPTETHARKNHRHSYGEHLWEYSWKSLDAVATKPTRRWRSAVKRLLKPVLIDGFRVWHRIKSLDPSPSEQSTYSRQPRLYAVSDEIVLKTVHGFSIIADGNDAKLTPAIVFGDYYEPREDNFVKKILRGGDWTIGVDSSSASFYMLAAQSVESFGRVFAYTPNPTLMRLLSKSAVMNGMHDRVVVRPLAAGEAAGTMRLAGASEKPNDVQAGHDKAVNSTFGNTNEIRGPDNLTVVGMAPVTLDREFPIDLPIKLIKIDAEGHEVAVLKGARRLLERRCIDFILIKVLRETARSRWRKELGGSRWNKLLAQLNLLTESHYVACTLANDGSLVEHEGVSAALDKSESRHLVLMARGQYTVGDKALGDQNQAAENKHV
jgi:inositol phosphorylceramide mannosyltransferase catalytic subunit